VRGVCWLAEVFLALSVSVAAQDFDFEKDRQPAISLNGLWRFHTGDDPNWAKPDFDDSHWSLLRSDNTWDQQGYKGYRGMAWYRFRVHGATKQRLGIYLSLIINSYEVFANGRLIGRLGKMPPNASFYGLHPSFFDIPEALRAAHLVMAIRVWHVPPPDEGGTLFDGGLLGSRDLVESRYLRSHFYRIYLANESVILSILESIAAFTGLALFLLRRSEVEYLWFALMELAASAAGWLAVWSALNPVPDTLSQGASLTFFSLSQIAAVLFYFRLFEGRKSWLFWTAVLSFGLSPVGYYLLQIRQPQWENGEYWTAALDVVGYACVIVTAWHGFRRKLPDARMLLAPLVLQAVGVSLAPALDALRGSGVIEHPPDFLLKGASFQLFTIDLYGVATMLFLISVLAILLGRFARTRRGEESYARELEAARTVQQVLVPEETPSIPGFTIESIYQPAQQVGGDFFQILPLKVGVLIAIGDVSGKGLPAAMTVSLIVGTLRTLAEHTDSPTEILQGLNRRLIGRGSGFTTCLIVAIQSQGAGLIASAGHLPPYRNGQEIDLEPSLPLGLDANATYREATLTLCHGDKLTFMTDGVAEAKNASGELFGFERTRQTSTESAERIVSAAKQFGQEDDITVLTLQYLGVQQA
jgi:stage II sporulation SpoE-like protein